MNYQPSATLKTPRRNNRYGPRYEPLIGLLRGFENDHSEKLSCLLVIIPVAADW
jgi:hypothetical protein